ncbi:hypothetical protein [Amycolatopsis nigrescens]|uniref:hypothetical protein n=1 Tax=Amycolatopsis nigrescens TaxID=381445 RepID=UPI00035D0D7B|nr:hypothetical protein [Amycolatopsis nigrescens]
MDVDPERTVDELIEAAEAAGERPGLSTRLDAVRAGTERNGVAVRVDLAGKLVGLELDDRALALHPDALAAEIFELSAQAGTAALRQGLHALSDECGPVLAAMVGEQLGLGPETAAESTEDAVGAVGAVDAVETDEVRSWALPH